MRRNGIQIMGGLLKLLRPLGHIMALCVTLGTVGHFCAAAITILAANLLLTILGISPWGWSFTAGAVAMLICAVARSVLRYGEQTCGHYIAFKLLAILRDKIFATLRRLAPAKLEGRGRGDLISLVTGDIELLEVFYAHTIAPVCIAVLFSTGLTLLIGSLNPWLGLLAAVSYVLVGAVIPLASSRLGREEGMAARNQLGKLNSYFLENLRGVRETLQYQQDAARAESIDRQSDALNDVQGGVKRHEGVASAWSGAAVILLILAMLGAGIALQVSFPVLVLAVVSLSASFGPVLALANLSATMDQTLAAGERVLSLLEEKPEAEEILSGETPAFTGAKVEHLSFSYGEEEILHDLTADFPKGKIIAVTGRSGSGKSTLLKLLMRFWNAPKNSVRLSNVDVGQIQTAHLRQMESYMTQDTDLFHDSIADNIRIAKPDASLEEVQAAAKKAAIHDFILTLPQGYDTPVGELGETLSGGQRQRIGLARAFLHEAPFLLLDEPTSNLDSLNEGLVLKALRESHGDRTILLVSHRKSTLSIADQSYSVESGRLS